MIAPPPQLFIPEWFARKICLLGHGEKCCKYLTAGQHGFYCAKLDEKLKQQIDMLKLVAKGDNCPGTPMKSGIEEARN